MAQAAGGGNQLLREEIESIHARFAHFGLDGYLHYHTWQSSRADNTLHEQQGRLFRVGDVEGAIRFLDRASRQERRNCYFKMALIPPDTKRHRKSYAIGEADCSLHLGTVLDFDAKSGHALDLGKLPAGWSEIWRTSSEPACSYQVRYWFSRPLSATEARRVHHQLHGGAGEVDDIRLAGNWRLGATFNWPNAKKAYRPESSDGQPVVCVVSAAQGEMHEGGGGLLDVDALLAAAPACEEVEVGTFDYRDPVIAKKLEQVARNFAAAGKPFEPDHPQRRKWLLELDVLSLGDIRSDLDPAELPDDLVSMGIHDTKSATGDAVEGDDTSSAVGVKLIGRTLAHGLDVRTALSVVRSAPAVWEHFEGRRAMDGLKRAAVQAIMEPYAVAVVEDGSPAVVSEDGAVPLSEDHIALVFAGQHARALRHVALFRRWYEWTGKVWREDNTLHVFDLVRRVCRAAAQETKGKDALDLSKSKTVAAVERLAKADRRLAAEHQIFDADPDLLNTPEGIVDLRTGRLLPHDITAYCTKTTAVGPSQMPTPKWDAFLLFVTRGDEEYAAYLLRMLGYMLTGHTSEHALFLAIGTGGNGKTVFANIVRRIMGDYAMSTPTEGLAATDSPQHPTDLARLRGARLALAQETEEGQVWAEAKIKRMTGGDAIPARFMRQDFFEYTPQFKLWVIGNHTPQLRNVDEAIKRRIHMLRFLARVEAAVRNPRLEDELWEEAPGILQKMIEGGLDWRERGLAPPPSVVDATREYLVGQDSIDRWISDVLERPGDRLLSGDAYESWCDWCRASGERQTWSKRKLSDLLADRGYERMAVGGKNYILGLCLSPEERRRIIQKRDAERNKRVIEQEAVTRLGRDSMPVAGREDEIPF